MPHGFQKKNRCIKKDGDQVGSGSVKEREDVRWIGL